MLLIALTSVTDYTAARLITSRPACRKVFLALLLAVNFSLLGVFNYFDFFAVSVATLAASRTRFFFRWSGRGCLTRLAGYFFFLTFMYALPLYVLHPMLEAGLARSCPDAAATHYEGWGWTAAMLALTAALYLGIIALRSPQASDFIYFQF